MEILTKPSKIEGDDDLVHYLRTLQKPLASLIRTIEGTTETTTSVSTSRKRSREEIEEKEIQHSSPICSYLAIDESGRSLVLAAHRELLRHEASLSTNKRSAPAIELLLRSSSATQLTRFGASLLPYLRFLACNRHASHVLQTFLSLSYLILSGQRSICNDECAEEIWDTLPSSSVSCTGLMLREFEIPAIGAIPSLSISLISPIETMRSLSSLIKVWSLVLSSSSEILREVLYDSGGTHILRGLIGILSGTSTESLMISTLSTDENEVGESGENDVDEYKDASKALDSTSFKARGRAKKSMKKSLHESTLQHVDMSSFNASVSKYALFNKVGRRKEFRDVFIRLILSVISISISNPEELGALACDVNASATVQLLIMASSKFAPNLCKVLCRRVSNWGLEGLTTEQINGEADSLIEDLDEIKEEDVDPTSQSTSRSKGKSKFRKEIKLKTKLDSAIDIGDASNNWLRRLSTHPIGSRLVECLLMYADPPLFHAFVESYFKGTLNELCADSYGNFAIQKLLVSVPLSSRSRDITDSLLMEASSCIGTLYEQRRTGVLLHIVAAAAGAPPAFVSNTEVLSKHKGLISYRNQNAPAASDSIQAMIVSALLALVTERRVSTSLPSGAHSTSVNKNDPSLARLILSLPSTPPPLSHNNSHSSRGSLSHPPLPTGPVTSSVFSLTFAHLLRFSTSHSRVILDSLLSLTPFEIASLATDPTASRHVLEPLFELQESAISTQSLLRSEHAWAKNKLHNLLKGYFASLASTRFGSWVVSKAFINLDTKRKASIATELVEGEGRLRGSGTQMSALFKMTRIEQFKTNRTGWEAHWVKEEVKKRNILESVDVDREIEKKAEVEVDVKEQRGRKDATVFLTEDESKIRHEKVQLSDKLAPHLKSLGF